LDSPRCVPIGLRLVRDPEPRAGVYVVTAEKSGLTIALVDNIEARVARRSICSTALKGVKVIWQGQSEGRRAKG